MWPECDELLIIISPNCRPIAHASIHHLKNPSGFYRSTNPHFIVLIFPARKFTMKSESSPTKDAAVPFDDRRADVILRSSDSVDFHVYKIILCLASPIFETMLSLPAGFTSHASASHVDRKKDGVSVVLMQECSDTLDPILRACYPGPAPEVHDLKDFASILTAVEKYDIKAFDQLAQTVMLRHFADSSVKVYAIACRFGFEAIVRQSSRACLSLSYSKMTNEEPPELSLLSSWQYRRLLRYHRTCGEVASRVAASDTWIQECQGMVSRRTGSWQDKTKRCSSCMTVKGEGTWYAPAYVWAYLARAEIALKEEPSCEMLKQPSFLAHIPTAACDKCKIDRSGRMVELAATFANAVHEALAEVCAAHISVRPTIRLLIFFVARLLFLRCTISR